MHITEIVGEAEFEKKLAENQDKMVRLPACHKRIQSNGRHTIGAPPPPPGEGEEEDIPPWEGEEKEAQRERGPQSERFETKRRCGRVVRAS